MRLYLTLLSFADSHSYSVPSTPKAALLGYACDVQVGLFSLDA
jgi:hypothetical protein